MAAEVSATLSTSLLSLTSCHTHGKGRRRKLKHLDSSHCPRIIQVKFSDWTLCLLALPCPQALSCQVPPPLRYSQGQAGGEGDNHPEQLTSRKCLGHPSMQPVIVSTTVSKTGPSGAKWVTSKVTVCDWSGFITSHILTGRMCEPHLLWEVLQNIIS